jgi:hypothetical protein
MIIKIHSRGVGSGSGPVDYLLGKDRDREDARLDRGDPEQMIQLIDSTYFAQKYTSGVLSFAERDLEEHQKQQIMDSFERTLLPGLDKDQYSVLWVQHQDKDRLELNFVVANVELQSGKRLQPYYDPVDRPRLNAWKDLVNDHYQLHDPNDPINKRELCTPNNLPKHKEEASKAITDGLLKVAESGNIKSRNDVIKTLEGAGFEIARSTPKSISIKDPDGGRNIRLKAKYMSKILDLAKSFEQKSSEQAKDTEQIVATEFKKHEKRLIALLNENEKAISSAINEQNQRIRPIILKTWMIVSIGIVTAIALAWGILMYQSHKISKNADYRSTEPSHQELANKGGNVKLQDCIDTKNRKRLCVLVNKDAGTWSNGSLMVPMGY